jgi:hypothetical protein
LAASSAAAQQEYMEYQRAQRSGYNNNNYGYNRNGNSRYYRVYRNGSYYQTDNRGAELLRQAVNSGYQQGFQQGQLDARYGRNGSYYGITSIELVPMVIRPMLIVASTSTTSSRVSSADMRTVLTISIDTDTDRTAGLNILGNILNGILNLTQQ